MLSIGEEENKYCIYRHTCPSGKVYIGQTKKKPRDRWANGRGYIGSPKFYNSKSVLLYTKDGEFVAKFVSTVACAEFLKTSSSNISAAIRDNRLICKKKYKVVYANT